MGLARINGRRAGAFSGLAAPIVAFTCILAAVASYPNFSWTNNALSDLGVVKGVTSALFNFGLVACGVLAFAFAVLGLFPYLHSSSVGKVGVGFFASASFALILIGVFNENFSPTHFILSAAFFVLLPISLLTLTATFAVQHQPRAALLSVVVALVAAAPWIIFYITHFVPNVAIPETISGLAGASWIITISCILIY
jgi:hypothetical membrane protein